MEHTLSPTVTTPPADPWEDEVTAYADPDGRFVLTTQRWYDGHEWRTFVGFTVAAPFRLSVLRDLDRIFARERAKLPPVIGCFAQHPGALHEKFVKRFGFVFSGGSIAFTDGVTRPFWLHFRSK